MKVNVTSGNLSLAVIALAAVALLIVLASPAGAEGRSPSFFQAENLFLFDEVDPAAAGGAAALTRTQQDISFRVHALDLAPGAHTLWAVIFNRPENCAGPCMGPDLANPDVAGSTIPVSGVIVGGDGVANFFGSLREGDVPEGMELNAAGGTVNGLRDTLRAEIHLVIREKFEPPFVDQLTTLEPGAGDNVAFAVFEPVNIGANLPPEGDIAGIYERVTPHSGHMLRFHGGSLSTSYVINEDGTFVRQSNSARWGFFEYPGTYSVADPGLVFDFEARNRAGKWQATASISGDCLTVKYNIVMSLADFVDGEYCR